MEVEEAAQAAGDIEPKVALPMHWGAGPSASAALYDGEVVILEAE